MCSSDLNALERRIGGIKSGSGTNVWLLTEAGVKLLHLKDTEKSPRKRFFDPTPTFMAHTLAVSEVYVRIIEICRERQIEHVRTELEPECWRGFTGADRKPIALKPDLCSVTVNGNYEDNWFLEIDLATESVTVVLDKCRKYALYYASDKEQKRNGVFPMVVWIVPNPTRKEKLRQSIADCRDLKPKNIFLIITHDELENLLCVGVVL